MEKNNIESPLNRSGNIIERENIVLHQTSEDIISEYEGLTNNNKDLEQINIDNVNKNEDLPHKNSIKEKISERLSIISSSLKNEKTGILYCLLAHFLWTSNSIYLKFLTQYFGDKFKNKTFLFSRGLMNILISYFLGLYQEGKILKLTELPKNILKALLIRINFNFFSMSIWVVSVWYLRISTCQIITSLSPIIIIFFSIIFLNEKYFSRYTYGIFFGILGSAIVILNEDKVPVVEEKQSKTYEIFIGVLCIILSIIAGSAESVCNKIMAKEKTPITTQLFYVGCSHCFYSFLWMLITSDFDYTTKYFIMCMGHGLLFFSGFFFFNKGLQIIDLSKTSIIQYSKIVFVFILGTIFLGQPVFFSDILGSCIIVGFMIYHVLNPVK